MLNDIAHVPCTTFYRHRVDPPLPDRIMAIETSPYIIIINNVFINFDHVDFVAPDQIYIDISDLAGAQASTPPCALILTT